MTQSSLSDEIAKSVRGKVNVGLRPIKARDPEYKILDANLKEVKNSMIGSSLGAFAYVPGSGLITSFASSHVKILDSRSMKYQANEHNAELADQASSDPSVWNALNRAGIFFAKNSKHAQSFLGRQSSSFRSKVTSVKEADELAEAIIGFCRVVAKAQSGFAGIILDTNDLKVVLAGSLKMMLNTKKESDRTTIYHPSPIIQSGRVGWVRFAFDSEINIEAGCFCETKEIEVDVEILHFMFDSEESFFSELRRVERLVLNDNRR